MLTVKDVFPGKPKFFNPININFKKKINKQLLKKLVNFIKTSEHGLLYKRIAVGMSGGIDSTIAAALCHKALGKKAFAVIVDLGIKSPSVESKLAVKIAKLIGIEYKIIKAGIIFKNKLKLLSSTSDLTRIHLRTRFINTLIFYMADNENALVIDTTDKSERLTARHAECFYGQLAPLWDIYKTELYELLPLLKLPKDLEFITPGCPEMLDIDAFGIDWKELDQIIYLLLEKKMNTDVLSRKYNIDAIWLNKLRNRCLQQYLRTETKKLFL